MSAVEQIAEIVESTVGALARLDCEELEALERRLSDVLRDGRAEGLQGVRPLQSDLALLARTELLGRCVVVTAENLRVMRRVLSSSIESARLV